MNRDIRRKTIEAINEINQQQYQTVKDPEVLTRISQQYEMAFRMQVSVPDAMNIKGEPEYITSMYGVDPEKGSICHATACWPGD